VARAKPSGQVTGLIGTPGPDAHVGRVELIETGDGFLVATGWAAARDGRPVAGGLTLEIAGAAHPVVGLFPRDDLKAGGLSAHPCAFCLDVPHTGALAADAPVRLLVEGEPIWSSDRDAVPHRPFVPVASFDEAGADIVSGWVFDPGLWHRRDTANRVTLAVGGLRLPVAADRPRVDLPFSAAREGRFLGFRVRLARELEARHDADTLRDLAGEAEVALVSARTLLATATVRLKHPDEPDGFVDFHGRSHGLDGWLLGGWVRNDAIGGTALPEQALVDLPDGTQGTALLVTYPRDDIAGVGQGLLAFVPGAVAQADATLTLWLDADRRLAMKTSGTAQPLGDLEAVRVVRAIVRALPDDGSAFARAVSRPVYEGFDTLAGLGRPIFFEVDEVIAGGRDGILLKGWSLDPAGAIASIRVRSGPHLSAPLGQQWLVVDRPDIADAHGARLGLDGAGFGFQAWAALPGHDPAELHVELTLTGGEVAFKPLPPATSTGRAGIQRILSDVPVTPDTVAHVCGRVLGPPVIGIARDRLGRRGAPAVMALGELPATPRVSIVVPLYGRLDFMMYQMALISEGGLPVDELVYVLDQPERRTEFLDLARSCHRRYATPARLVLPPENLGFAGASNAGMIAGAGDYVCFLNSDVVPDMMAGGGDWLDRLVAAMAADPGIGILGAQLLFEDGTLQHGGMAMRRLPGYGNMPFPHHPGKGRLPATGGGVRDVPLVTGALMLMRRDLAIELGGFDTDYVTGDFEDTDLCMKVRSVGLRCAVHDGVRLFHLERQSQGSAAQPWRQNLTLVNACTFADRWDAALTDIPVEDDLQVLA